LIAALDFQYQVLGLAGCTIENGDEITGARVVDKSKMGDAKTIV